MSSKQQGKRQKETESLWQRYRAWLAGMTRGERIRYRCLQVGAVLAVLVIAVYLFLRSWITVPDVPDFTVPPNQSGDVSAGGSTASQTGITYDGAEIPDVARSGQKPGVYTFLLAGRDVISGATDTILLLTYDSNEKTIHGMNIPRDTMINTNASSKRINSVYSRNRGSKDLEESERAKQGMDALMLQVSKLTGILPNFYIVVEWEAVGRLVDALGGVEFEVPWDMNYDDPEQNLHIHQKQGLRVLTGEDAMQVVRWRKNNSGRSPGDVGRLAIQQDFLKAVAKECLQPSTFLKVPELAQIFTESVTTDLTVGNILAFAQLAYGMDPDTDVSFSTAPLASNFRYRGADMVTLSSSQLLEVLNNGMNPYLRDIQSGDLELLYRNSDGSFGVTRGALADSNMGKPGASFTGSASQATGDDDPDDQAGDLTGSQTGGDDAPNQTGDTSQSSGEGTGTGDTSQPSGDTNPASNTEESSGGDPLNIDPSQIFPNPSAGAAQVDAAA